MPYEWNNVKCYMSFLTGTVTAYAGFITSSPRTLNGTEIKRDKCTLKSKLDYTYPATWDVQFSPFKIGFRKQIKNISSHKSIGITLIDTDMKHSHSFLGYMKTYLSHTEIQSLSELFFWPPIVL